MKKLLFLLLFLPLISFGQTISVSYTSATGNIDGFIFPKNTLSYNLAGSASIRLFVQSSGAVWGTRPYTDFRYNGNSFPSRDSLASWLDSKMFGSSDTTQYIPMPINVVSSDTITVSKSGTYTFTGALPTIWRMPTVSNATGMTIFIINRGSAALTIISNAAGLDLDVNASYSASIIVAVGENYVLRGNSLKLVTVNN